MAQGFEGHHSTPWAVFKDNRAFFERYLPGWDADGKRARRVRDFTHRPRQPHARRVTSKRSPKTLPQNAPTNRPHRNHRQSGA
jgi:hypothetical protein